MASTPPGAAGVAAAPAVSDSAAAAAGAAMASPEQPPKEKSVIRRGFLRVPEERFTLQQFGVRYPLYPARRMTVSAFVFLLRSSNDE